MADDLGTMYQKYLDGQEIDLKVFKQKLIEQAAQTHYTPGIRKLCMEYSERYVQANPRLQQLVAALQSKPDPTV
jgi:malic enzyme